MGIQVNKKMKIKFFSCGQNDMFSVLKLCRFVINKIFHNPT